MVQMEMTLLELTWQINTATEINPIHLGLLL